MQTMKRGLTITLAALMAASLACNINVNVPRVNTGPTQTLAISEAAPEGSRGADVQVTMGAGTLTLDPGAQGLVEGQVQYNVADWKPTVTHTGNSVAITQGQPNNLALPLNGNNLVNDWTLKLGNVPMTLTVDAGAYEGTLNLGGVPLTNLTIQDGASKAKVVFATPNPQTMSTLTYDTGASNVDLEQLANANAQAIDFKGGAGSYQLDFSGKLQRDLAVSVASGVSSVRLVVPAGVAATVNVSGGLNNVSATGNWTHTGDSYTQTGSGPKVTITVDMGVGNLNIDNQ
jgi:hypothetical protein